MVLMYLSTCGADISHPVLEEVGIKILVEPLGEGDMSLPPGHLRRGDRIIQAHTFVKHNQYYMWTDSRRDWKQRITIKEPHLPYKIGLDVTQRHPLRRTRFGQYQASSAALG